MKRSLPVLAMLLAGAVCLILPVGPTAAFQPATRGGARPPATQPPRNPTAEPALPARTEPVRPVREAVQPANPAAAAAAAAVGQPPSTERVVPVTRGSIHLIDQVTLASDVAGIVDQVAFREGDEVPSGGIVARLRDDIPAAAYETAKKLAESEVEREYAIAAHRVAVAAHQTALVANREVEDAVPRIEVERLQLDADRARLQIKKADNDLDVAGSRAKEAEAQVKAFTIRAPFEGVVTRVHKLPGEAVRQGDPILEMVSTQRIRVEGYVEIRDFWNIKRGNLVHVQIDLPEASPEVRDRVFEGALVFVDRTVHPVTNQVRVWAEIENLEDLLKGGLHAKMTIYPDRTFETDPPKTAAP